ncbi:MAG: PaaI family thioesterase [Minwuia sp.]|uniref:PaaI family thioesterase n=1 Tax=Minwuia sp. TaxID=2493630 RepID=UPI003A87974C
MTDTIPAGFEPITNAGNFSTMIGPTWQRREDDGSLTFGLMVEEKHLNGRGVVHGGMLMSFMDQLLGRTAHNLIGRKPTATVQLDNQFLASVREGDWIEGRGAVERETRSLLFVTGRLTVRGKTVLLSSGVWKILGQ